MNQKIFQKVSVISIYKKENNIFSPYKIFYSGQIHLVKKIGLHHQFNKGSILFHSFSVATDNSFFKILFNTKELSWTLEEISDGYTD